MTQIARPSGTTVNSSMTESGAATLHECLNDDSDSTFVSTNSSSDFGYGPLDPLVDPVLHTGHVLRARVDGGPGTGASEHELWQGNPGSGGSLIVSVTHDETSPAHWQEYTLLEAEAALITDYSDLYWRLVGGPGGPGPHSAQWLEYSFEIPDAAQTELYGIATETDAALSFVASRAALYGIASEADAALTFIAEKVAAYGIAVESDAALLFVAEKLVEYGIAAESDAALAFTGAAGQPRLIEYSLAAELDEALAFLASTSKIYEGFEVARGSMGYGTNRRKKKFATGQGRSSR